MRASAIGLAVLVCLGTSAVARADESIFRCSDTALYTNDPAWIKLMAAGIKNNDWTDIRATIWYGVSPELARGSAWYERAKREGIQADLVKGAAAGDDRAVLAAIRKGAEVNYQANFLSYMSALIWAAGCGHLSTVKLLVEHGANVNLGNHEDQGYPPEGGYGETPLMWAAAAPDVEIVKFLLSKGADPNARAYSIRERQGAFEKWNTPLLSASNAAVAEVLLQHGADPNATRWDGTSPLMDAAGLGEKAWCELLLRYGADPALKTSTGETASDFARMGYLDHPDVVALIDRWEREHPAHH